MAKSETSKGKNHSASFHEADQSASRARHLKSQEPASREGGSGFASYVCTEPRIGSSRLESVYDDVLDEEAQEEFDLHLKACRFCRNKLDNFNALLAAADDRIGRRSDHDLQPETESISAEKPWGDGGLLRVMTPSNRWVEVDLARIEARLVKLTTSQHSPEQEVRALHGEILSKLGGLLQALQESLGDAVELVLHDLRRFYPGSSEGTIHTISGKITGREVRDYLTTMGLETIEFQQDTLVNCLTTWESKPLKTSSTVLRDSTGKMFGLFCVNIDLQAVTARTDDVIHQLDRTDIDLEEKQDLSAECADRLKEELMPSNGDREEFEEVFRAFEQVLCLLQASLGSVIEIALHDLSRFDPPKSLQTLRSIWGDVTGRNPGSPMTTIGFSLVKDKTAEAWLNYSTRWNDKLLKGTTVVFRTDDDRPWAVVCLNVDRDRLTQDTAAVVMELCHTVHSCHKIGGKTVHDLFDKILDWANRKYGGEFLTELYRFKPYLFDEGYRQTLVTCLAARSGLSRETLDVMLKSKFNSDYERAREWQTRGSVRRMLFAQWTDLEEKVLSCGEFSRLAERTLHYPKLLHDPKSPILLRVFDRTLSSANTYSVKDRYSLLEAYWRYCALQLDVPAPILRLRLKYLSELCETIAKSKCTSLAGEETVHFIGCGLLTSSPGRIEFSHPLLAGFVLSKWCLYSVESAGELLWKSRPIHETAGALMQIADKDLRLQTFLAVVENLLYRKMPEEDAAEQLFDLVLETDVAGFGAAFWRKVIGRFPYVRRMDPSAWATEAASLPSWFGRVILTSAMDFNNVSWEGAIERWPDRAAWYDEKTEDVVYDFVSWLASASSRPT